MRTLVCERPGEIAISDRPRPSPGPGQVVVRIRRAGVCGTDLHIFEGSHPFLEYPRVIGHELSGEVAETGRGVPDRGRSAGLCDPLSRLRRLRRVPARQDQLLPAHRRFGRPHRRGHGRLRLRAGSQRGAGRRSHPRSGRDDRIPGDRGPRDPPREPSQGRPHSRRRRRTDRHRLHVVRRSSPAARSPPSTYARTGSTSVAASLPSITRFWRGRRLPKRSPNSPPENSSTSLSTRPEM